MINMEKIFLGIAAACGGLLFYKLYNSKKKSEMETKFYKKLLTSKVTEFRRKLADTEKHFSEELDSFRKQSSEANQQIIDRRVRDDIPKEIKTKNTPSKIPVRVTVVIRQGTPRQKRDVKPIQLEKFHWKY